MQLPRPTHSLFFHANALSLLSQEGLLIESDDDNGWECNGLLHGC